MVGSYHWSILKIDMDGQMTSFLIPAGRKKTTF